MNRKTKFICRTALRFYLVTTLLFSLSCSKSSSNKNEIQSLIEQLAISPDPPQKSHGNIILIPKQGETIAEAKLQRQSRKIRADKAADKLYSIGLPAIPFLLEHLDDNRESTNHNRAVLSPTVSYVCGKIIMGLASYNPKRRHLYGLYSFLDSEYMDVWWQERKRKTLGELKEESIVFALAMVRYDRILNNLPRVTKRSDKLEKICIEVLEKMDANKYEDRASAILKLARTYTLPKTPLEVVETLRIKPDNYLNMRLATMLKRRASLMLRRGDEKILNALVQGVADIEIGDHCFSILMDKIDAWVYWSWPEFGILTRKNVATWWKARKGKSLRELKIEAIEHSLREVEKKEWKNGNDKEHIIKSLNKGLRHIRKDSKN